jgi:hypothetical protein
MTNARRLCHACFAASLTGSAPNNITRQLITIEMAKIVILVEYCASSLDRKLQHFNATISESRDSLIPHHNEDIIDLDQG